MRSWITILLCFCLWSTQVSTPVYGADSTTDTSTDVNIKDGEEFGGFIKSSILLFAVVFAGITIAKSCLRRASSVVFLVSAILYVVAEIALYTGFYQEGTKAMENYKAKTDKDEQVDSLREASKQAKRTSKIAIAKSVIQAVTAVGFIAAGIIVIIESIFDWPKFTGDCFAGVGFPGGAHYAHQDSLLLKFLQGLIPEAHAAGKGHSVGSMLGAMGVGAAAALLITSSMAGTLKASFAGAMSNGYVRAALFFFFSGIAIWSTTESAIASKELQNNAKEYNKLAEAVSQATDESNVIQEQGGTQEQGRQKVLGDTTTFEEEGPPPSGCLEGDLLSDEANLDDDCSCLQTKSCTKTRIPDLAEGTPKAVFGGVDLVDSVAVVSKTSDAVFSGDLKRGQLAGGNAKSLAIKLGKHKLAYQKLANAKLKESGEDAIDDWGKLEQEVGDQVTGSVVKAFHNLSAEERASLSPYGLAKQISQNKGKKKAATTKKSTAPSLTFKKAAPLKKSSTHGFKFLKEGGRKKDKSAVKTLKKVKRGQKNAVARRSEWLFVIITKRYLSTAWEFIFGEEEE